ncbi:hypothetical protein ACQKOH_07845 [Sphingomonas sp. NPDC092331]|uniref:Uncharacterized protein n=1 Tax=Sphingomonas leidyi TaxID=68569 RepID=A0A7X5UYM8_9SPHN|nr:MULTISPECIES: hypothetical protein [Sphingomonas]MCH7860982.1 hypothetical protein [Pseudomonadota bacterium]MBN8813213.1 hypothetical protein [Sphingomonas sp.]MBQ1499273.1 hypothetical protein [Sphingomonas sp.]MDH4746692.1 hypothetical protein [Sphingomonas sp. CBMAI 2297]NIJ64704.1 hypothetical protein [Sphingomonas leidyi]
MGQKISPAEPAEDPGVATAEQGVVLLDGPDGVAIAMTPRAAEETGRRLVAAAHEAASQGSAEAHPS